MVAGSRWCNRPSSTASFNNDTRWPRSGLVPDLHRRTVHGFRRSRCVPSHAKRARSFGILGPSKESRLTIVEERDQNARWIEPTSIQRADLTPDEESAARRAFRAWQQYNATGDRTELVELGILPADGTATSEPADE